MRRVIVRSILFSFFVVSLAAPAWRASAEENQVTFPDVEKMTHYTTVERGVTVEHMRTSPEALDALQKEQPVPAGTQVVLVDFQSGKLTRYLVMQKAAADAADPNDWAFQWFWPDGTIKADEDLGRCHSCHQSRTAQQFMFTYSDAVASK